MTTSPTLRRRARRLPLLAVFGIALLFGAACTPQEAVWMHFADNGSSGELHSQAQRVVSCESGWNPTAVSPTNDHGLFQINRRWHEASFTQVTGQSWDKVYDPYWNALYARHIYNTQGWSPWSCRP